MTSHSITIVLWKNEGELGAPEEHKTVVRWRCSCGRIGPGVLLNRKSWLGRTSPERTARNGGARHVAAMEKR